MRYKAGVSAMFVPVSVPEQIMSQVVRFCGITMLGFTGPQPEAKVPVYILTGKT